MAQAPQELLTDPKKPLLPLKTPERLLARRGLLQLHDRPYLRTAIRGDQQREYATKSIEAYKKRMRWTPNRKSLGERLAEMYWKSAADSRCGHGSPGNLNATRTTCIAAIAGANLFTELGRRQRHQRPARNREPAPLSIPRDQPP